MFGKIVIFGTLLAVSFAELPISGPYAPSGWRPQGSPFNLPNEYIASQIQRKSGLELEITKERVDYAGQLGDKNAGQLAPNSAYLPPSSDIPDEIDVPLGVDILRVQGLPNRPIAQFKIIRASQLNTREYYPQRQFSQVRRPQKLSNKIRQQQFNGQPLQSVKIPAAQYGAPVVQPSTQYGVPAIQLVGYPDPRTPEDKDTDDVFNFPNGENEEDSSVTKGEYFVLTPEKTLQKVSYKTSQTEEEARNNGFSAQLKYTPVDQIDGPLYKYNEQGQLVRIYRK